MQKIEPAELTKTSQLCIVENSAVRPGFISALKKSLDEKNVDYRVVDQVSADKCEWKATYTARWSWDMAIYMAYAEIKIYKNGKLDGEAVYDATNGVGNMEKFIKGEDKVRELVDKLIQIKYAQLFHRAFG